MHKLGQVVAWIGLVGSVLAFWSIVFRLGGQRRSIACLLGQVVLFVACLVALGSLDALPDTAHASVLTLILFGAPIFAAVLALFERSQQRPTRSQLAPSSQRLTAAQIGAERRAVKKAERAARRTERIATFLAREQAIAAAALPAPSQSPPSLSTDESNVVKLADQLQVRALLRYRDAHGHLTDRDVTIRAVYGHLLPDGSYDLVRVAAICHVQHATRTFRVDRMISLADLNTGEVRSDIRQALLAWSGLED